MKKMISITMHEEDNSSWANNIRTMALTNTKMKIDDVNFIPFQIAKSQKDENIVTYQFLEEEHVEQPKKTVIEL